MSEDPIQFYGGTNFYAYTHNRPTFYVDAFGLQEGWNDYKNVGNVFTLIRARLFANEALDAAENWARQHHCPPVLCTTDLRMHSGIASGLAR